MQVISFFPLAHTDIACGRDGDTTDTHTLLAFQLTTISPWFVEEMDTPEVRVRGAEREGGQKEFDGRLCFARFYYVKQAQLEFYFFSSASNPVYFYALVSPHRYG